MAYFEDFPIARLLQRALPYPAFQLLFVLNGFVMFRYVMGLFRPNSGADALAHQTR